MDGADDPFALQRFVDAQQPVYAQVCAELAQGAKRTHWMWFVFPQRIELGRSATARRFGIGSLAEARAYVAHPLLGPRLRECTRRVLAVPGRSLEPIFGAIDALKFRSSMTLFEQAAPDEPLFAQALQRCCGGERDPATLALPARGAGPSPSPDWHREMAPPAFTDPAGTWNQRFAGDDYLFGTEPNAWLREHAGCWRAGQRVLCVADGEGRNSVWLAERGLRVQAFDLAAAGVAKARRLAQARGVPVDFQVADCDAYAWPVAALDGVAAIFVQFADPAQRARLFAKLVASLAPGGWLVLQGYTPKQLDHRTGGPPFASHLYTAPMLREAFAALDIVELREYEAEIHEGSGHCGRSALIGLVARRS